MDRQRTLFTFDRYGEIIYPGNVVFPHLCGTFKRVKECYRNKVLYMNPCPHGYIGCKSDQLLLIGK